VQTNGGGGIQGFILMGRGGEFPVGREGGLLMLVTILYPHRVSFGKKHDASKLFRRTPYVQNGDKYGEEGGGSSKYEIGKFFSKEKESK
jgi:hypothetical protein